MLDNEVLSLAKEVTEYSLDAFEEGVAEELRQSSVSVNDIMIELNRFEEMYRDYYSLVKQKRKFKGSNNDNKATLDRLRHEIQNRQITVYEQFFKFQNAFNAYFKQKIQMVFVTNDNGMKLVVADNDLKHTIMNQYGTLEYTIKDTEQQILKNTKYDSASLDRAAVSVYDRWDKAKQDAINSGRKRQAGLPILWKVAGAIDGRIVNNKGTIAEAYANFYLNSIELNGSDLEYNVATYVTDPDYGMASVDNTMGFALGDVGRAHMQYAIKSERAGLAGMHRVYQFIAKIKKELAAIGASEQGGDEALIQRLKERFIDEELRKTNKVKQIQSIVGDNIQEKYDSLIKLLNLPE